MTKAQFLGLRKQGFTIQFVSYGEDIKAKIGGSFGDATFRKGGRSYAGKKIRVKEVNCGEDVRLGETNSLFADFEAC